MDSPEITVPNLGALSTVYLYFLHALTVDAAEFDLPGHAEDDGPLVAKFVSLGDLQRGQDAAVLERVEFISTIVMSLPQGEDLNNYMFSPG